MHSNDSFPLCLHRHMHAKKIGFHEEEKNWPVSALGKCFEDFFLKLEWTTFATW